MRDEETGEPVRGKTKMRHFPIPVWIAVLATGSWHNPATGPDVVAGLGGCPRIPLLPVRC